MEILPYLFGKSGKSMSNFKVVKNGYDTKEVDDYIFNLNTESENKFHEQKMRISDLKRELEEVKSQLKVFKEKNANISDALVVAVETAKQIESSSKNIYELEIKRVRSLYDKWQKFLNDFMKKYPDLQAKYDTNLLLKTFSDDINNILNQNKKTIEQKQAIENDSLANTNTIGLRMLINKMSNVNRPLTNGAQNFHSEFSDLEKAEKPIIRNAKPSPESLAEYQVDMSLNDEANRLKKDMIKPISSLKMDKDDNYESLVDKFLSDDDTSYEDNAYSKVFLEKQKNDGFNLKEAVNPTEDLEEIMKSFSFYPENEKDKKDNNK